MRLDGNIDVNAILNSQNNPAGDGGRVFIDSAYLFQSGNIFANGFNGGQVQINVGGMTLGNGARIEANGMNSGGVVSINASGPVDLRRDSLIQPSGLGLEGSNVISVEGSLVNVDGVIKANTLDSERFQGGTIRLVATGQSDMQNLKDSLQTATQNDAGDSSMPTLTAQEHVFLLQRASDQIRNHDGDVFIRRDTSHATPEYMGSLTIANNGAVTLPTVSGPYHSTIPDTPNFWMGRHFENGIARISLLANGNVNNETGSYWGGSVNIATKGDYLGGGILTTSSNPNYTGTLQAGSIMIKAGHDIKQSTQDGSYLTTDGLLFGGRIHLYALHDINL